jgi:hypothetical protein
MKRTVTYLLLVAMFVAFTAPAVISAGDGPLLFKGSLCEDVQYQKSIEAVSIGSGRVYAACDYRMVIKGELVSVYYLGSLAAYSLNGSRLWINASGYVVKIVPHGNITIAGSLGGIVLFTESGKIIGNYPTSYKLYDFEMRGNDIYAATGDVWFRENSSYSEGMIVKLTVLSNSSIRRDWAVNVSMMTSRIRLGPIIYAGAGLPSGYSGRYSFGGIFGISYDGKLLWNISTGEWVRDMELWDGNLIAGTGINGDYGHILLIDKSGRVLWNESTFFVEDLLVQGDRLYVSGVSNGKGRVAVYDLKKRKKLWEVELPYRAKTLAYPDGILAVGIGKFESKREENLTRVYSEGGLYLLDPKNGKVVWKDTSTGYVRSLAVNGTVLVAGTGSSDFYVYDVSRVKEKKKICGPGVILLAGIIMSLGGEVYARKRQR